MANSFGKQIVTNGLVLCYDAANKRSYSGAGTSVTDLSSRGNTGTLINGVGFSTNNGGRFVFDGVNDYIDCGTQPIIGSSLSALTAGIWVYVSSKKIECLATNGSSAQSNTFKIFQQTSAEFSFNVAGATSTDEVNSNFEYQANQWYYLVGVWPGANQSVQLYANSILRSGTRSGSAQTSVRNGDGNLYLGIRPLSSQWPFSGQIAYFEFYNRALTAAEIQQNFQALRGRFGI